MTDNISTTRATCIICQSVADAIAKGKTRCALHVIERPIKGLNEQNESCNLYERCLFTSDDVQRLRREMIFSSDTDAPVLGQDPTVEISGYKQKACFVCWGMVDANTNFTDENGDSICGTCNDLLVRAHKNGEYESEARAKFPKSFDVCYQCGKPMFNSTVTNRDGDKICRKCADKNATLTTTVTIERNNPPTRPVPTKIKPAVEISYFQVTDKDTTVPQLGLTTDEALKQEQEEVAKLEQTLKERTENLEQRVANLEKMSEAQIKAINVRHGAFMIFNALADPNAIVITCTDSTMDRVHTIKWVETSTGSSIYRINSAGTLCDITNHLVRDMISGELLHDGRNLTEHRFIGAMDALLYFMDEIDTLVRCCPLDTGDNCWVKEARWKEFTAKWNMLNDYMEGQ